MSEHIILDKDTYSRDEVFKLLRKVYSFGLDKVVIGVTETGSDWEELKQREPNDDDR